MNHLSVITEFWALADVGKSAAIDVNRASGEFALRCTRSAAGELGNGPPPTTYSDNWSRVVTSINGQIERGAER